MKYVSILIMTLFYSNLFSQEVKLEILDEVFKRGELFSTPLKNGEIESLRKANPPKDTWVFSKMEEYKQNLGSNDIIYGSILMPNIEGTFYSYNLFAYDIKRNSYYFVAIVSYKISKDNIEFSKAYLFTEKQGWLF